MSKKHHGGPAPVPPGNQPKLGHGVGPDEAEPDAVPNGSLNEGTGFHEQDPQRRLGGFDSAGEHSRVQPGALNDGGSASRKG